MMNSKMALLAAIVITVTIFFSGITATVLFPNEALAATDISVVDQNVVPDKKTADGKEHKGHAGGHNDPFADVLLLFALAILAAMVGRWGARLLNQPSVLGELLMGVLVGNVLYWLGGPLAFIVMHMDVAGEIFREVWQHTGTVQELLQQVFNADEMAPGAVGDRMQALLTGGNGPKYLMMTIALWIFSSLGVILLLFMVGLESRVDEMLRVGPRAMVAALLGIIVPFVLGYAVSAVLLPESTATVHLFIGATLTATSVGITARVFKDLGVMQSPEAKLILGAAVIDDILGLIVLATVTGIVVTGEFQWLEVLRILAWSLLFLSIVVIGGSRCMPGLARLFDKLDHHHLSLLFPLILAFIIAWAANMIGLATIIGAFAAGLILNPEHLAADKDPDPHSKSALGPLEDLFAPVFFLFMGMQVNLASFLNPTTLWLGLGFVIAAIIGKLVTGLAGGSDLNRMAIGIGMVPRGEVGLIFASIGKGLGVVSDTVFTAVVVMVIVTTLIAPAGLKWAFRN